VRIDPERTFSTPGDAPLVPTFPFTFRDVEILTVLYRTDADAISRIVPKPLEPAGDTVVVHLYKMNDTDWFGAYNESAVQVQAVYPPTNETAVYSPYLYLDHDGAIAAGREVYGQPKKFGRPSIEVVQDLVVGRVARNGIDVITATMPYKTRRATREELLTEVPFVTNVNLKVIPNIDGTSAVRQLTARDLGSMQVHECWRGPCTIELRPNAQAPVHRLPVREPLMGFYWRCDFTLDHGRVLHDYLADDRSAVEGSR
jgi:acetoacetate decarboxylase